MSKLAVKYNNDLNSIPLRNFTSSELNIFLTICANIKEKNCDLVNYDFDKLRELARYESTSIERFVADLKSTYSKLLSTSYTLEDERYIESFTLFNRYTIDKKKQTVEIQVNENFKYILNDLNLGNFTRFELREYTDINSTYSKALYMRLKQWKSTGKWEVTLDEFKRVLSIPDSYKMSAIDNRILKLAEVDLAPFFKGLKIQKLDRNNKKSGKGRPVKKLVFTFQQQDDSILKIQPNKYALGKYENVYLTEAEHKQIKLEMKKYYLVEEVSEWKHKKKSESNNNDYALIMAFDKNKEKNVSAKQHELNQEKVRNEILNLYADFDEEELIDIQGNIFNQLKIKEE
ncbi:MAG: replication initiation protein [Clostridiales bacterium]|nr:replication initiation protein [Clostridiales bacterium]